MLELTDRGALLFAMMEARRETGKTDEGMEESGRGMKYATIIHSEKTVRRGSASSKLGNFFRSDIV